jgi:curved DNA-binding protein CbpA
MPHTFYDFMMLSPRADRELITAVYRHLAKRYHPDKDPSPAAAARMLELNEAYATLSDREKRSRYDEVIGLEPARGADGPGGANDPDGAEPALPYGEAGPPPANPEAVGSELTFGRYRGWTLNQVGRYDRDYLEWLSRTTMGRNYREELDELLRRLG